MSDATISSKAAPVRFEKVSKVFGKDVVAVDSIDLHVTARCLLAIQVLTQDVVMRFVAISIRQALDVVR